MDNHPTQIMTTPANPTPEPTPLTDAAKFLLYFEHNSSDWNVRGQGEFRKGDVVPAELSADLERQLSDTRRRLAEVEKERDEAQSGFANALRLHGELYKQTEAEVDRTADVLSANHALQEQLTALRNAADGMAANLQECIDLDGTCANATEEELQEAITNGPPEVQRLAKLMVNSRRNLAAYAALISEGVGKPTTE